MKKTYKRFFFKGENKINEILTLFELDNVNIEKNDEIEISYIVEDKAFGIYKNTQNSAILIQDTTNDEVGLIDFFQDLADEIEIEKSY